MKNLIVLIFTLLVTLTHSLGQSTPTFIKIRPDSIIISKYVGRAIVRDLIKADSLSTELRIIQRNWEAEKRASAAKDSLNAIKDKQIAKYVEKENGWVEMDGLRNKQLENERNTSKQLSKDLKKVKRENFFIKTVGTVILGIITYAYITK